MAVLSPRKHEPHGEPEVVERLDSWKEIAAYLRRDVRTVQRWEARENLPVRRHLHDTLGSVYAYRHELDAWRDGRQPSADPREVSSPARRRPRVPWVLVFVLAVMAAGWVASRLLPPREGTPGLAVLRTVQLTNDRRPKYPPLATDGSRLYFTGKVGDRWVVTTVPTSGGEPEAVPIPLTSPAVQDVSPDGSEMLVIDTSVGVLVENLLYAFPLYRVPVGGGAPRRVGEVMAHGASWLPDGRTILYTVGRHMKLVDRDGAAPRPLVTLPGLPACASASPDGRLIRLSIVDPRNGTWSLWEIAVDGTALRPLLPGWSPQTEANCGSWSPDGDYVFLSSQGGTQGVWVLRGGSGRLGHEAAPVRLTVVPMPTGASRLSRDGQRFFLVGGLCSVQLVRWDPGSREFVLHPAGIPGSMVDYSRDGAWIVYVAVPSNTLWRARADGTERRPITAPPLEVAMPRWSPDGGRVAFQARAPGEAWRIYVVPSSGGPPVPLADGQGEETDPGWSPDGRSLVFAHALGERPAGRQTLRVLDLATGRASELPGSEGKYSPRWSPDGRHLAALPADWQKLLVLDLETGQWSEPVTGDLGFPTWSRDGTHLYYQTRDDVIHRLGLSDGRTERVVSRTGVPRAYTFTGAWFGLDPEGRLLVMRDEGVAEVFAYDLAAR